MERGLVCDETQQGKVLLDTVDDEEDLKLKCLHNPMMYMKNSIYVKGQPIYERKV